MADTQFLSNNALTVEKWSAVLFKDALKQTYFGKYVGGDSSSLIQTKEDLLKEVGDKITFGLLMKLSGAGRKNDEVMEGYEEAMTYYDFKTTINLRQNGVKAAGKMTLRRTKFDIKSDAKENLAGWIAEKIDEDTTKSLSGVANTDLGIAAISPSTNRKWYGGQTAAGVLASVADDASITSATNHLFGPQIVKAIKRKAKLSSPKVRPIKIGGKEHYVMFVHPYQVKALKATEEWLKMQYYANVRGETNPLFEGAIGMIDGVILHEYEFIETRLGAGGSTAPEVFEAGDPCASGIYVARALFCGAQAGVHAWGQYPGWYEKDFDYGRVPGVMTDFIYRTDKPKFNSEDYGVITVDTAYVPD